MVSFNIAYVDDQPTILNSTQTLVRLHRRIDVTVVSNVLSILESCRFPVSHTEGIQEVHFTYLKNGLCGDYLDKKIRIACNVEYRDILHRTFIHEVGHHVDSREATSSTPQLLKEWGSVVSGSDPMDHMEPFAHPSVHSDPSEYFAVGFEVFYTDGPKALLRYPVLRRTVARLHASALKIST